MTCVTRLCNNDLDCYLASPEVWKCSAFDRPQGFRDKANLTGKMASRRDGFWGIKIPGFFCPAGTYGMYGYFHLLCIFWMDFGKARKEASPLSLYLCFAGRFINKDGCQDYPSIRQDIFNSLHLLNRFWWNLTGAHTLSALPSLYFSGRSVYKDCCSGLVWLWNFLLLLCNWTDIDQTRQEGSTQHPVPSCVRSIPSTKADNRAHAWYTG